MKFKFLYLCGLLLVAARAPGHAQQIVCERLLTTPGLEMTWPTACTAPNGEFIVTGAARMVGTTGLALATHTFVARLSATGCDTLWTRRLPHSVPYYSVSAVRADAHGIWLLTPDTVNTVTSPPPFRGVRLWRLTTGGRVRRVVRPVARSVSESPINLLTTSDGGLFVQVQNTYRGGGFLSPSVLRFDSTAALRWRRDYGMAGNSRAVSLCYTPAGKVLFTGMIGLGTNYDSHARVMEIEPSRGDSLHGITLPWGPGVLEDLSARYNSRPLDAIALTSNGYALLSVVNTTQATRNTRGQLTRIDANYNVLWRYQLPVYSSGGNYLEFTQVRELADGTLLALVRPFIHERTFWLYRFNAATGTLLNVYPFTSAFGTVQLYPSHLLPVAADSSLVVVGGSRPNSTNQVGPIYVARLRVPGLLR